MKGKRRREEHALQVAIADFLGWTLAPPIWWTGIDHAAQLPTKVNPKTGRRYSIQGQIRKRRGVKKGIGDFLIIAPGPNVLWIEVKREDGGSLTPEQKAFADAMHAVKAWCVTCRSVAEVERAVRFVLKQEAA